MSSGCLGPCGQEMKPLLDASYTDEPRLHVYSCKYMNNGRERTSTFKTLSRVSLTDAERTRLTLKYGTKIVKIALTCWRKVHFDKGLDKRAYSSKTGGSTSVRTADLACVRDWATALAATLSQLDAATQECRFCAAQLSFAVARATGICFCPAVP